MRILSPRWQNWLAIAVVFAASLPLVARSYEFSATFDEPFYLDAGLTSWRTGSNKMLMKAGTMPLPVDLQTLPVYLWERSLGERFVVGESLDRILLPARRVTLVFWFALLAFGFLVANHWGGVIAGRAALLFLATEPNLIAHAGLATTDIAVTAAVLAATYAYAVGRPHGRGRRIVVPGIVYGVAILCKVSALAFVPIVWFCIEHHRLAGAGAFRAEGFRNRCSTYVRAIAPFRADFIGQFAIALMVTFLYCGSDWQVERTFVEWTRSLPEGIMKSTLGPLSERLKIFTNAGEALAEQVKHNMRGHGSYLAGSWHPRAVPHYFFVALAVKLTLPAWLFIGGGVTARWRDWWGSPAGWIALALLAFTLNCRVQIGIRLVFPLVTFLLIAAAVAWLKSGPSKFRLAIVLVLIAGQFACSLGQRTDLLRHANPIFGGPGRVHEWLSDSNADWGQALPALTTAANGRPIAVWYFGVDPRVNREPLGSLQLHTLPPESTDADFDRLLGGRILAVSSSIRFDNPRRSPAGERALAWLATLEEIDRVGPYFIFRPRTSH